MIAELEARAASVHLCPSSVGKSLPAQALRELSPRLPVYETAEEALDAATWSKAQADGGLALVTGSLFLVADLLHHITGEPRDPRGKLMRIVYLAATTEMGPASRYRIYQYQRYFQSAGLEL